MNKTSSLLRNNIFNFSKYPLVSGSLVMVLGSNLVNFLNYLFHSVMGKMLGPGDYGEMVAIISLVGLVGIIPSSLSLVVIKYISATKNNKEAFKLISWLKIRILIVSLIFSSIFFITSPLILAFLHVSKFAYLILATIFFLFSIQSVLNRAVLQGLLKFKAMILSLLIENGAKLFISTLFVYLGLQVGGALGGFVLSAALGWYVTSAYLRFSGKQIKIKVNLRQILTFALPVLIQSIAVTSLYSSDMILVKHFFSPYDAGVYAALSTLGKIIFFGAGPIGSVMFPLVSQRYTKGEDYRKIFNFSLLATLAFAVFMLLIYWLLPNFTISMLYGTAYLEAEGLLVWFGVFITLFTLSSLFISFHLSLGNMKVVILPVLAAIAQIVTIYFYHGNLFTVIIASVFVTALLLGLLLIYSSYERGPGRNKIDIGNSTSI